MLESSKIALKFPEEKIPLLPGLKDDHEVRGVIALHLELTVFCDNNVEKFKENVYEVLDDLDINDPNVQERVVNTLDKYEAFLKTLIAHLHSKGKVKDPAKGTWEYQAQPYISLDEHENQWVVDLDKLYAGDAKYDEVNLYEGQVVIIFNPNEPRGRMLVDSTGVKVRTSNDQSQSAMMQQFQQNLMNASTCTCNQTPCTCGAAPPSGFDDDDDEVPENLFDEWDSLMSKANDRDVILVYQDGSEVMRF